jgi:hypothetical protein
VLAKVEDLVLRAVDQADGQQSQPDVCPVRAVT